MNDFSGDIASVEDIIADARAGRMFILVDHEDRENEGDLVIPAQMATPEAVNFMATHGRGLICLTLTGDRLDQLGLPLMASKNSSRHETAFTVSIEAREGVTTGISAHDRARTIAVAIDPDSHAQDIATPGHVFPLRAREGGVLVRAGHTEAATDISRLAGLNPAGVICEIMKDDGSMARLPDLISFAQKHNLKIGTISDLIAYRRKHDNLVREIDSRPVTSVHGGDWTMRRFNDSTTGDEHIALTMGDVADAEPVLVRVQAINAVDDLLGLNPSRNGLLQGAMAQIAAEGRGVIVLLSDVNYIAPEDSTGQLILRQYGLGAQILSRLGVHKMILLTNSPAPKMIGIEGYGLSVASTRGIPVKD
jgi:3,4-dihydroxy 2-butanone 4-phosphate synthase/GTP cyclohydrolase II